jgi:UDP-glucose 4-epimerase
MILIGWSDGAKRNRSRHTIALFGYGLVGKGIAKALRPGRDKRIVELPFDWLDGTARVRQAEQISKSILQDGSGHAAHRVSVVWSAGAGSFTARMEELLIEEAAFADGIAICKDVAAQLPEREVSFHFMSSAGGLFEGQRNVGLESTVKPLRPYAHSKLDQERMLSTLSENITKSIYRLSTVYGYFPRARTGLISALVRNGLAYRTTRIFGDLSTLRDYVHTDDIGKFVASRILCKKAIPGTFLLASGKPSSMTEIIAVTSDILQRPLYLQFDPRPSNSMNNSYLPSALPEGWSTMTLATGIRDVARNLRKTEFTDRNL